MAETWNMERALREPPPVLHPLGGANLRTFIGHYANHGGFSGRSRLQRATAAAGVAIRFPFYHYEKIRWRRALAEHELPEDPVFIVGYWRSGTTHLHNLLSQDARFAFLTFGQTTMPWDMLRRGAATMRSVVSRAVPPTRGMDNVPLSLEEPAEEEIALGNMNPLSYYCGYYFPQQFYENFRQTVLLEGVTGDALDRLRRSYEYLVTKVSYVNGGKPLLFKNPCATGRMLFLKELFPRAKFIHIVRNPYAVFASSLVRFARVLSAFAWQRFDNFDFEQVTIDGYRDLMRRYLDHRDKIPPDDLFETSYEAIVPSPLDEIGRIYDRFQLPEKTSALAEIARYVDAQKQYRKNEHILTRGQVARIEAEWKFSLDEWGYARPDEIGVR